MVLKINGADITPYIAKGGIKWQRSDMDGSNAGRSISGDLIRDRVAIKWRIDVTCRPLTATETSTLLSLIEPEFVTVQATHPRYNQTVEMTMYSNNFPVSVARTRGDETVYGGVAFPLVQR